MRYVDQVLSIEQVYQYNPATHRDDGRSNWLGAINECLARLKGAEIVHISQGGEYSGPPVAIIKYRAVDMERSLNPKNDMRIGMHVVSHTCRSNLGVNPGDVGIILGFDELPIGTVTICQFRVSKREWSQNVATFNLVTCAMLSHEYDLTGEDALAYAQEQNARAVAGVPIGGRGEPPF